MKLTKDNKGRTCADHDRPAQVSTEPPAEVGTDATRHTHADQGIPNHMNSNWARHKRLKK